MITPSAAPPPMPALAPVLRPEDGGALEGGSGLVDVDEIADALTGAPVAFEGDWEEEAETERC